MYKTISPPHIFYCTDIDQDPDAQLRARRITTAYPNSEVIRFDQKDLADLMRRFGIGSKRPRMGVVDVGDPDLLLTVARFTEPEERQAELASLCAEIENAESVLIRFLLGHWAWRGVGLGGPKYEGKIAMGTDQVCRPAWRVNTMYGCPHRCVYCSFGQIIPMYVNMAQYCRHLAPLMAANPWQNVYLYDDASEALFPEPELGAVQGLIDCCRQFPDRYLVIHTKSANVDFLESIQHDGRCIMTWSLTSAQQSRETERLSGTMAERVAAARKCADWGYPVRFKFKPIVPFRGWRDDAREMVREAMTVKLDNISLFTIAWMNVDELKACFPVDQLDPDFLREAEAAKEQMATRSVRPYPHHVRAEIYRFYIEEIRKYSADVPITLCTEAADMWQEFAPILGQEPGTFVCGCGPMTIPGLNHLCANPWSGAKPVSVWAAS